MSEPKPEVFEIDINKKYLLTFDPPLPLGEIQKGQEIISNWIKSDEPILIVPTGAKLVKVETADE